MSKQYWLKLGDEVTGPFSNSQIRQLATLGLITSGHQISLDRVKWVPATKVKGLNLTPADSDAPGGSSTQLELNNQTNPTETPPLQSQAGTRECPFCAEKILAKARKCKHCGEFLDETLSAKRSRSRPDLGPEKILWEENPSLLAYVPVLILGAALILAFGLGILIIILAILDQKNRVYTITNHKVMVKWGIISRITKEVAIRDVRNINMTQGVFARLFGIGTIAVASAGTGTVDVSFFGVEGPAMVRDLVRKIKEESDSHSQE
ncbi:MAG: PH domain-containing protein [Phycisphaerales bacterium]|nr:MAG: PH domain-containing protein [Phycisphaerales bacterium]